ncbi:MAG TPA: hypothetical protein VFV33_09635 [Gemmatimonadaceae bacterium]|nr:hypothetical protein [Gemmatimonadaceae bacterium]
MRRSFLACVAVVVTASASACGNLLETSTGASRSVLGGEAMRLQLSKTTVTEGEFLPLTVTLTNTGDSDITFEENTCPFGVFEVEDAAGTRIDPRIELILCAAYTRTMRLRPGDSYSWSPLWVAARYAPSTVDRAPGVRTVRIRARYWVSGKQLVASAWQSVTVNPAP